MSIESKEAISSIQSKITELTNVHRVVSNCLNLVGDTDIKAVHAEPVAEIIRWLQSFKAGLENQKTTLESTLPKPEVKATEEPVLTEVK